MPGEGRGGDSRRPSLRGVNYRFRCHLGCLGRKVTIFVFSGIALGLCLEKNSKLAVVAFFEWSLFIGVSLSLSHTHNGLPEGFHLIFRRASP